MNIKQFLKYLFIFLVLLFSHSFSVYAKENLEVTNIKVIEHSGDIEIEDIEYHDNTITSAITFNTINDSITLEFEVNNNTDNDYQIQSILSDFEGDYFTIETESINKIIKSGKKESIQLKIIYETELLEQNITLSQASISLNFKKQEAIIVNPLTKIDTHYLMIFFLLIVSFVFFIFYKNGRKAFLIVILCIIPCYVFAEEGEIITISFESISIKGTVIDYPVSETIYWALQDNDGDNTNEVLVLSNEEIEGNLSGSFPGDTQFNRSNDVPWIVGQYENNLSYNVTTVNIEGKVVPTSTAYWFYDVGYNASTFTASLNDLIVSKTTDMSHMFSNTGRLSSSFYLDLSNWDTSNVTDLSYMFYSAGAYATTWIIEGLGDLDTSSVTNMKAMFLSAAEYRLPSFELDLSGWDTSNVTNMAGAFGNSGGRSSNYELNVSNWKTSNVTDMSSIFYGAGYGSTTWKITGLEDWDTSNVTNMNSTFKLAGRDATSWSIGDLSEWKTSNVTDMSNMFYESCLYSPEYLSGISEWDVSNVTNMSNMFYKVGYSADSFILDLSKWNTSSVTNMNSMFKYAGADTANWSIGDVSEWNTSNVIDMSGMFYLTNSYSTEPLSYISEWNTSNVTNMSQMFYLTGNSATEFSLDLRKWNTSKVTNMTEMFAYAGYRSTSWNITIPQTNGNGISNTTSRLYGKTTSTYATPLDGKSFTIAS